LDLGEALSAEAQLRPPEGGGEHPPEAKPLRESGIDETDEIVQPDEIDGTDRIDQIDGIDGIDRIDETDGIDQTDGTDETDQCAPPVTNCEQPAGGGRATGVPRSTPSKL